MYSSCRQEMGRDSKTSREVFIDKKAKSLYVANSSRQNNIKHKIVSFLTRQATKDFQSQLIHKSLATKNKYVKLFIDKLLARKFYQTQFKEYHFQILNEKHTEFSQLIEPHKEKIKNKIQRMCFPLQKWIAIKIEQIPLIYPQSIYKTLWDLIATAARLYFLYMIPVDIAWTQQSLLFLKYQYSTTIMSIILLIDIIVSLNTAFYQAGQIVTNRISIIKNVLFQSFCLEWISVLVVVFFFIFTKVSDTIVDINSHPYFILLFLFLIHFKNVQNKGKQYEMALNFTRLASSWLQLFKFTLLIFYVIHLFGCLWFWVGQYSETYFSRSWIQDQQLVDSQWNIQYLSSFYYACVTMFTIGYGDITPQSDEERIVAIILIMVSSVQLPYSINTVGEIIREISSSSDFLKKNIRIINAYLHKKKIPYAFQEQIREYLKQYWHMQEEQETKDENTIISQLSDKLQEQLMWQVHTQVIREMPFFSQFSRQFQKSLSKRISVVDLIPNNEFRKETDQFVCYLERGEISVSLDGFNKMKLKKVLPGDTFGLKDFILGTQSQEIYKSIRFSRVLSISRYDFLQLLKEFPRDFEIYCKFRDDLLFSEKQLDQQCLSCQSITHSILTCPMLHYLPQKDAIIKRFQYNHNQKRRKFNRNKRVYKQEIQIEDLKKIQDIHNKLYYVEFQEMPSNEEKSIINLPKIIVQNSAPAQSPNIPSKHSSSKNIPDPYGLQFQGLKYSVSIIAKPSLMNDYCYERQNTMLQPADFHNKTQFNNQVEEQLKQRYQQLKNYKNLPQKDQEAISLLIMKYKNFKKFDKKEFQNFEQMQSFTDYYPEQNINFVIQKINERKSNNLLIKYLPYLLYPNVYYERFKKKVS